MKYKHIFQSTLSAMVLLSASGCTDLGETLYDQVDSSNFYNTRDDIIRSTLRPFEHAYWTVQSRHVLNELTADQLITPTRDGWWDDGGKWRRLHYHQWNVEEGMEAQTEWNGCNQGIVQCNYVIEDLERLDPAKFGFSTEEFDNFKGQVRTLRAYFYLRLLDAFRNIPFSVSYYDSSKNTLSQVPPLQIFEFIESELKASIPLLVKKTALGEQGTLEGQWTQAGAAALLVRLYLNAQVYIGEERYNDCAVVAQDIIDGDYGTYQLASTWNAIFDYDNDTCDEMIFGFPSSMGYSYWLYQGDTYMWTGPANGFKYFKDEKSKCSNNPKYAASPSYDLNGNLYTYQLGMPVQKFRKYPGDERMKLYRNLSNGRYEGLFLYGYLDYIDDNGVAKRVDAPGLPYTLYIRDAVGQFHDLAPNSWPSDKTSNLTKGDHNSGWHFVKYPRYSDDNPNQMESDFVEIRLPEVIYSLAECKIRAGLNDEAAVLLNSVRRRNYPDENLPEVLYAPEGKVKLDLDEMLDEWGREFFAEGRRRIDLIRFGKFSKGTWWDKSPDPDDHYQIFQLTRPVLNSNPNLKQNPGYGN